MCVFGRNINCRLNSPSCGFAGFLNSGTCLLIKGKQELLEESMAFLFFLCGQEITSSINFLNEGYRKVVKMSHRSNYEPTLSDPQSFEKKGAFPEILMWNVQEKNVSGTMAFNKLALSHHSH